MNYYFDVFKKYAVFSGRATRKQFWMFELWNVIVYFVLGMVTGIIAHLTGSHLFIIINWLYALAVVIPSLAVSVRRLHDTNRTGWWLLIDLVPIVGAIMLIVFCIEDSRPDNKYGPNQKMPAAAPTFN